MSGSGGGVGGSGGAMGGSGGARPDRGSESGASLVRGLSHVALAVREADPVAERLAAALGAVREREELLDGGALRVVFLKLGSLTLELLEPRSSDHTVARFIETRGPGLHHVSLEVDDLEGALRRAAEAGVRLVDETPRPGAHGSQVAFLHPKSLFGVLIELCRGG
jgi:methylmalonyl-CoA/ethylmalonyl-CoA epimerase